MVPLLRTDKALPLLCFMPSLDHRLNPKNLLLVDKTISNLWSRLHLPNRARKILDTRVSKWMPFKITCVRVYKVTLILASFLVSITKCLTKGNLRKGSFILAPSSRMPLITLRVKPRKEWTECKIRLSNLQANFLQ